jgi:hypothetical protein
MANVYILHENSEWITALIQAFEQLDITPGQWFLDQGEVAFDTVPPQGVFYNRMSASSHTRGHRFGPELTRMVLTWLERHNRRVVNNSSALYLEVCKLSQYAALNKVGVQTPTTIAVVGKQKLVVAATSFNQFPFILKPNRGGKGLGVQLFYNTERLQTYIDSDEYEEPLDGTWLIQQYIKSPQAYITRCEFVGGKFIYSVRISTEQGFELCPADSCQIGDGFCPTTAPISKFQINSDFIDHPIVKQYQLFLKNNGIEIAGIELIKDENGDIYTYDVNTNTNYNRQAEIDDNAPVKGMEAIAFFLAEELNNIVNK